MIAGLIFTLTISFVTFAEDLARPDAHPCTGESIPLTSEKSVVKAIECLYQGRVAKVEQVNAKGNSWFYQLRILIPGGRVKTVDVNPETGLPLDPKELKGLNL